jgi:hypothetical protein
MPVQFKEVKFRNDATNPIKLRVEAPIGLLVREVPVIAGGLVTVAVGRPDCPSVLLRAEESVTGHGPTEQTYTIESLIHPRCFLEQVEAHYLYPTIHGSVAGRSESFDPRKLKGD